MLRISNPLAFQNKDDNAICRPRKSFLAEVEQVAGDNGSAAPGQSSADTYRSSPLRNRERDFLHEISVAYFERVCCLFAGGNSNEGRCSEPYFLGDSITCGGMLPSRDTQSPPVICAAEMRKHLSGRPVFMANEGHSGHTTVDFLPSTGSDFLLP